MSGEMVPPEMVSKSLLKPDLVAKAVRAEPIPAVSFAK